MQENETENENKHENIKVIIRIRPFNSREENAKLSVSENKINLNSHEFNFDQIFDCDTTQEKIFEQTIKDILHSVTQGYNATIFAYGATSSGKSYTMFGSEKSEGIIPRSCKFLFQYFEKNTPEAFEIKCSFLEIYIEKIKDLLTKKENMNIRYGVNGVYIEDLTEKSVFSSKEIMETIKNGMIQRTTSSTELNSVSSRSHAVLTLIINQKLISGEIIISKLHFVDLAGSENVEKSKVQGINLLEAQKINKSLSCLGNVIYSLTESGRSHIPYRDSKLTFLLQDSLGGNSKTLFIAAISPSLQSYSETLNTLKFAKRVKDIKNIPKINKNENVSNLLEIIEKLNKKIVDLENKLQDSQTVIKAIEVEHTENKETILYKTKCDRLLKNIDFLNDEIQKQADRNKILLQNQKELLEKMSENFFKERTKNCVLISELEQLRMFQDILNDSIENPAILQMIVKKIKIPKYDEVCE